MMMTKLELRAIGAESEVKGSFWRCKNTSSDLVMYNVVQANTC